MDGKLCSNDGMFKIVTRNKVNMAAATMLYFEKLYSPLRVVKYIKQINVISRVLTKT